MMQKYLNKLAVLGALALGAAPAFAAIDVSDVTTLLSGDVTTAVTSIGVAILSVLAVVVGFKFVRRAM